MRVTVKFFASVREIVGARLQTIDVREGATVADVWHKYLTEYPRLATMSLGYAVNHAYSPPERVLHEGDEVAFIPPVSGG